MWSNLQCTCFAYITHLYVRCAQIQSSVTKLPLYILHTHGVHFMACPWARYLSRDALSNAHFLFDTAAGLGNTIQRISPKSRYRLWSYTCLREMHTQKFRANRPILLTRAAVAFIFFPFRLKFFVQHSAFAREREMRSFFLHRACYEVLCVSLINLALPCPGPSQFFTPVCHLCKDSSEVTSRSNCARLNFINC